MKHLELEYIDAAVMFGAGGSKHTSGQLKIKLDNEHPELVSSMSKSRNIAQQMVNKKRKQSFLHPEKVWL